MRVVKFILLIADIFNRRRTAGSIAAIMRGRLSLLARTSPPKITRLVVQMSRKQRELLAQFKNKSSTVSETRSHNCLDAPQKQI